MPPPVVCRLLCQEPTVPLHPFPGKINTTFIQQIFEYHCTAVPEREEEEDAE